QHAGATARFQDAPYRQPQVPGERGDQARPRLHFAARGDRGARVEVVALVVLAAETHRLMAAEPVVVGTLPGLVVHLIVPVCMLEAKPARWSVICSRIRA